MFTTVLFDIDGVMLSEERYFDASALTVHELLTSPQFLGLPSISPDYAPTPDDETIQQIRNQVFADNRILEALKNVGVNANWDMVYFVFAAELAASLQEAVQLPEVWEQVVDALSGGWTVEALRRIGQLIRDARPNLVVGWRAYDALYDGCGSRAELLERAEQALDAHLPGGNHHALWNIGHDTFQTWYLGDEYSGRLTGKRGFLTNEYPIVDPAEFSAFLASLRERGYRLGIATGRPQTETHVPLEHFGWLKYFDLRYVTTASDVVEAERQIPSARPLSKPHPFSYLRSLTGDHDAASLLSRTLPLQGVRQSVLIIGDSIADALAAERLGASFAAVLTGLEGEAARPKFERLNADFIFSDVLAAKELF
ncbi:HAD family hydrolase [Alicyclobacillus acidiphilus]|uniref:HAD family hydrolase n=1 Tax=Alicyclobacillus acidiphilus TaxID=182455 RepID=UPI0008343EC3|nr:HAD hydrolase-like protein [Alicyclobacillus acidiphilus]